MNEGYFITSARVAVAVLVGVVFYFGVKKQKNKNETKSKRITYTPKTHRKQPSNITTSSSDDPNSRFKKISSNIKN